MIHTVAETGSTNADVLALAASGAEEGFWLRAERQTAGRGRQGRPWASETGNLYASTLVRLRPTDPPAATLALVAGVAVHETVELFLRSGPETSSTSMRLPGEGAGDRREDELILKWPNDLLLGQAKLAGILLERQGDVVVAGVGVNLAHCPDLPDRPTTSLAAHGAHVPAEPFAAALAEGFARRLACWRNEGVGAIRRAWLDRAHPPGMALTARLPDGTAVDGLFEGLDPDGALTLRLASGGRRVIHAADVFLL